MKGLEPFSQVWLVDFEFVAAEGEAPVPVCMVGHEVRSGRTLRLWLDELGDCPIPSRPDVLLVAYHASAELGCFLALGWPLPQRILDLCAEFKNRTYGVAMPFGNKSLLAALMFYELPGIDAADKDQMRELIIGGGPWSASERIDILKYCESDVVALAQLLPKMLPDISLPHALIRGRYMVAVAKMERRGIPIDVPLLELLRDRWPSLKLDLITAIDDEFDVYEGSVFKLAKWEDYLARKRIAWPRLDSGQASLSDDTFKEMARVYPQFAPLRELRHSLGQLRFAAIPVGKDGRNRTMLATFNSRTGRNQPSSSKFIFGASVWLRGLIKPAPGMALAYVDYGQQEFGIAAYLSHDPTMIAAYESGDPYLEFAKQTGAAPPDATKESHGHVREQFKVVALGVLYGMGVKLLSNRLNRSPGMAASLLSKHRDTYPTFWRWSDSAIDHATIKGSIQSVLGWTLRVGSSGIRPGTLRNFPMQANGSEMLRLACCLATERGLSICAPIHDATLVESRADQIKVAVVDCREAMEEASRIVLGGHTIRTDAKVVIYPDRYEDPRGRRMWNVVIGLLGREKTTVLGVPDRQVVSSSHSRSSPLPLLLSYAPPHTTEVLH